MDWTNTHARLALIERVGIEEYNRQLAAAQAAHPLVGKRVTIHGRPAGVVDRVIDSRFGKLAHVEGGGESYWRVDDCKVWEG